MSQEEMSICGETRSPRGVVARTKLCQAVITVKTAVVGNTHMLKAVLSCCLHRSTVSHDLRVLHLVGVRQDI